MFVEGDNQIEYEMFSNNFPENLMSNFCVYAHFKNEQCLYVGCGSSSRPYDFIRRNPEWIEKFRGCKPSVIILETCSSQDEAFAREKFFIEQMKVSGHPLVNKDPAKYWLGKKRDPDLMKRMNVASHSEEAKAKRTESKKGWTPSEEHRRAVSEKLTGRKHSEETRANISAAKRGRPNGLLGTKLSEETKRKMSETRKTSESVKASYDKIWETRRANSTGIGWKSKKQNLFYV